MGTTQGKGNRRPRRRTTRLGVRVSEKLSRALITIGGIGTIVAVALIFFFLVWVVLPLFSGAQVSAAEEAAVAGDGEAAPLHLAVDEYGVLAAVLREDGRIRVHRLESGRVIQELQPFAGEDPGLPTAWSIEPEDGAVALGFRDGSLRLGDFGFTATFPVEESLPADVRDRAADGPVEHDEGILQRTAEGNFRFQRFFLELGEPLQLSTGAPIRSIAHSGDEDGKVVCAWTDAGLVLVRTRQRLNLLTGEVSHSVEEVPLAYQPDPGLGPPAELFLTGLGDNALLFWPDGRLERLDLRSPDQVRVAEVVDLVREDGATLTAQSFLTGRSTLVVGDSTGAIRAWFRIKPDDAGTPDGIVMVSGHELALDGPPVTALTPSPRSRLIAAGRQDGSIQLYQVTTEELLAEVRAPRGPIESLCLPPKEDGLVAIAGASLVRWVLDPRHPEASLAALFTPVWYEGYTEPEHVWQAESGTDDFEPKLGFVPLIYGTLKATLYSMLFGAPLALLAALYTSEFMDRRLRVPVKSVIEMMASLPSVVLGFLAALVIAPFAQKIIPATLAVFVTVPFVFLAGAYLWQLLPQGAAIRWSGWRRFLAMAAALPVGVAAALGAGPLLERVFFAGSVELWLDGQRGSAVGGWMLILLPAAAFASAVLGNRLIGPWLRHRSSGWTRRQCALADLARFGAWALASVVLALVASALLDAGSFDPRGTFVGTYVQRNALIVGFVMGFAIIPIIYTLAEDALSSVPEHLRLASLGAGATPWQTAVRVIVPTAMSGLFSAVMIGLGRAVGETMIVLMATGNTPVMEMNIFNGFRTLSANIAVELPEAVKNSTHYRTLFLAALVLFAITFALNTLAELVRMRFRKRAVQL